jgi:DNA ligase D-like protein (predicted ligase)
MIGAKSIAPILRFGTGARSSPYPHRRGEAPAFIAPMAAKIVQALPAGDQWLYEVKFDGYRALVLKDGGRVQIRSRNNRDLTRAYAGVAAAAGRIRARSAILDGEIVALDGKGHPSFQALQNRSSYPNHTIVFYVFDLLHLDGEALMRLPLEERKRRLATVVEGSGLLLSPVLPGTAEQVIDAVRRLGLEGVIAKRKDSRYQAGIRGNAWVKLKLERQQEFVVGGYRPGPHGIDALLVGYYHGRQLRFAGKVRAGFAPHIRRDVFARLNGLDITRCPFVDLPSSRPSRWGGGVTAEQMREMRWVKPHVVAQIRFVEWTADGHLRHAAFMGLREDKDAKDVRRDS